MFWNQGDLMPPEHENLKSKATIVCLRNGKQFFTFKRSARSFPEEQRSSSSRESHVR